MKDLGKGDKTVINNNGVLALDVLLECELVIFYLWASIVEGDSFYLQHLGGYPLLMVKNLTIALNQNYLWLRGYQSACCSCLNCDIDVVTGYNRTWNIGLLQFVDDLGWVLLHFVFEYENSKHSNICQEIWSWLVEPWAYFFAFNLLVAVADGSEPPVGNILEQLLKEGIFDCRMVVDQFRCSFGKNKIFVCWLIVGQNWHWLMSGLILMNLYHFYFLLQGIKCCFYIETGTWLADWC